MPKANVIFHRTADGEYTAVFTTDHSRKVALSIREQNDRLSITNCSYLDRVKCTVPGKLQTKAFQKSALSKILAAELDKAAAEILFDENNNLTADELIGNYIAHQKPNLLIFLSEGDILRTMFKNRFRRTIFLEITRQGDTAVIRTCHYADTRDSGKHRIPHSLVRFSCRNTPEDILSFVNDELEGGFTNILAASEHDIVLNQPICGAI